MAVQFKSILRFMLDPMNLHLEFTGPAKNLNTNMKLMGTDENQEGYDGSYIECYMKEHRGSSFEDAREHTFGMISDAWKRLNEECLKPNPFSPSFIKASLNIARLVPVMYSYDDNQRLPSLEEHINSMLYESIPLEGKA
ncbi:hypothetical protein HHK36_009580 [Tetracentron sinense]|uniref:Terpene synthase metal-binding domain-containing protein n=1 Tax=Tetracentron sinense TaxID=13715 RepID=A0A834ZLL1_TETSI|nr:hypothetical protein HHK36_009580 [Tetracentron sinense]